MHAFQYISQTIDGIYKEITGSQQSSATLIVEDEREPYKAGIINCILLILEEKRW